MEINVDELNKLSIFQLRAIAREVGVYSPTTLKKEQMIDSIMKIYNGELAPHKPKTKQGRPPKDIIGNTKLIDILVPKNLEELSTKNEKLENVNKSFVFNQEPAEFQADYKDLIVKGIIVILENNGAILRKGIDSDNVSNLVYIAPNIVVANNLRNGDEILCNAIFTSYDKPMVLKEILAINGEDKNFSSINKLNFDNMEYVFTPNFYQFESNNPLFEFMNWKIPVASNIFIYGDKTKSILSAIELVSSIKKTQKLKVMYLNLSMTDKEKQLVKNMPNIEIFCNNFEDSRHRQRQTVELFIERVKRLVEMGYHLILLIDDTINIGLLTYEQNQDIKLLKLALSLSKQTLKGSATTIAFFPKTLDTDFQKLVVNTVKKLEDIKIVIE